MQLFNQINARKIGEKELNVFSGFLNNYLFLLVLTLTFFVQIALVQVGGKAVKTYPLDRGQNLVCFFFGALELLWGLVVKMLPVEWFQLISLDEHPMNKEELEQTVTTHLKKSSQLKKQNALKRLKQPSQEGGHVG
jgi:uncharacterized membrane protein